MDKQELERIRRRWDEYSETNRSAYRAFIFEAHRDVGRLLQEIDRLRDLEGNWVMKTDGQKSGR
jgi:arylsulfatase A-like enzyme